MAVEGTTDSKTPLIEIATLSHMTGAFMPDKWVGLSIFYTRTDPCADDPPEVQHRGIILYGEGLIQKIKPAGHSVWAENLGERLRVLRVVGLLDDVANHLAIPYFDHRLERSGKQIERLVFGFVRRPPILGLPSPATGVLTSPASRGGQMSRLHQFVREDKAAILASIVGSPQPDRRAREVARQLLGNLDQILGENFRDRDSRFFGDVIIVERLAERSVVSWEVESEGGPEDPCCAALFTVDAAAVQSELQMNARIFGTDGLVVDDLLRTWRPGDANTFRIDVGQEIGSIHLRAWLEGQLVLDERNAIFANIGISTAIAGPTVELMDRLSSRLREATNVRENTLLAATHIKKEGMRKNAIVGRRSSPWKRAESIAATMFGYVRPVPSPHEYFPVGAEGRAEAVMAFAAKISDADQAWLVDPWFDAIGAAALLPRIKNEDARLTVVTNLPDETLELGKLVDWLRSARAFSLPSRLEIYRIARASGSQQDFHDRFVITARAGERPRAYVLTNSFSGLASKFSLIVAEVSSGLAASLLDSIEELLEQHNVQSVLQKLWPDIAAKHERHRADYLFTGWRLALSRCVPRMHRNDRDWLSAAAAMGFLTFREGNRIRWVMTEACRRTVLNRLLSRPRMLSRFQTRRRMHGQASFGRSRILPLGIRVALLGEMAARGPAISTNEVASRLRTSDAFALERHLRSTCQLHSSPFHSHPGTSGSEMAIRQAMRAVPVTFEAVEKGLGCYDGIDVDMPSRPGEWGRLFAYGVLCHLDPDRAIRVAEELLDPALLGAVIDNLRSDRGVWSDALSAAFIRARSPLLRALGAQSLVPGDPARDHWMRPRPPHEPLPILSRLAELGIRAPERAMYLAVWGSSSAAQSAHSPFASALIELLAGDGRSALDAVIDYVLKKSPAFLHEFVNAAVLDSVDATTGMLQRILRSFASRLRLAECEEDEQQIIFNARYDILPAMAVARAVVEISRRLSVSCRSLIESACDRHTLERAVQRLSPVRRGRRFDSAAIRLGWSWLIELLATGLDSSGEAAVEAVGGARRFLEEVQGARLGDLRDEICRRTDNCPQPCS